MSSLELLKTPEAYTDDIPLSLAIAAHRGTSFEPENRGEWTPSLGCWQAYRNSWSVRYAAQKLVVKKEEAPQ